MTHNTKESAAMQETDLLHHVVNAPHCYGLSEGISNGRTKKLHGFCDAFPVVDYEQSFFCGSARIKALRVARIKA